ncbi:hypothetical protein [Autumnicola musiva]|uniref:Uncharacterized protein n=1 Tax=Autumnicola musiva TaxID=3075589 RepID=A0ABU3D551_9FLAO|nr:hypothetical protein [Zunongwangia sp. F117]MDT0676660.1 hypothetical protein [Zunongwangia sp. F117]
MKLSKYKKDCAAEFKKEIERLQNELRLDEGVMLDENLMEKCTPLFHVSRYEKHGLFKECYRREKRSFQFYNCALSQVNGGSTRELLLSHKHRIYLCLRELKCMGIRIYEVEDEANEVSFNVENEVES